MARCVPAPSRASSRNARFDAPLALVVDASRSPNSLLRPRVPHRRQESEPLLRVSESGSGGKRADASTALDEPPRDDHGWGRQTLVTLALTVLTSSQGLLIAASKKNDVAYGYAVTSANCTVEAVKLLLSLAFVAQAWATEGVTEENSLRISLSELARYPVPAALYLAKNLLQYYVLLYTDAPSYQILKNLNIVSTGILYRLFLQKQLSNTQWAALTLLALGCTVAQLSASSDAVLTTPAAGIAIAVAMAILSGFAGVYTELILKSGGAKRNVNAQNVYLYAFGVLFNIFAIFAYDYDAVARRGYFHGYTFLVAVMIANHAASGIAVSMVMKFANNIVKVYSTSVAMILTTLVSIPLFGFELTVPFVLGTAVVSVATFLHYESGRAKKAT